MPTRTILNSPIALLGSTDSSDARNFKTTFSSGGSYATVGPVTILSLSHTPKYTGSTVCIHWGGMVTVSAGVNYTCYLTRDGVTTAGSNLSFRNNTDTFGTYSPSSVYSYANSASNVAITYNIVETASSGAYPLVWAFGSITAWEILP